MGGTTLHAGIVTQWFEILLLLLFLRYATMVVNGILFGVMTPLINSQVFRIRVVSLEPKRHVIRCYYIKSNPIDDH